MNGKETVEGCGIPCKNTVYRRYVGRRNTRSKRIKGNIRETVKEGREPKD